MMPSLQLGFSANEQQRKQIFFAGLDGSPMVRDITAALCADRAQV